MKTDNDSFKVLTATAPSCWASYLINGDASGIDETDKRQADAFIKFMECGTPVDCSDAGFKNYHDARIWGLCNLAADCQRYSFLRKRG